MKEMVTELIAVMILTIIVIAPIIILTIAIDKIIKLKKQKKIQQKIQQEKIINTQTFEEPKRRNDVLTYETINNNQNEKYPYHRKYILTKNEYYFYKRLINITDPLGLSILAKIRLADLIETNDNLNASEKTIYFNKIKAKHVDFVIANQMRVIMIIELDDTSHSNMNTIERDSFVNNALIKAGYTVVRTSGDLDIITKALIDKGYHKNLYTNTTYYK